MTPCLRPLAGLALVLCLLAAGRSTGVPPVPLPQAGRLCYGAAPEKDADLAEDERVVREARVGTDAADLLAFFRKRTPGPNDQTILRRLVRQLGARSFAKREEASKRLATWGPAAMAYLAPALGSPDLEVARRAERCVDEIQRGPGPALPAAAARLLARRKPPEAVAVLLDYLPFADDGSVQDEVLTALLALGQGKARLTVLRPALAAPQPLKRAGAAYVLGRSADKDVRAAVKPLLGDKDAAVRLRAAQGLLAARDKDAVPALIDLLAGQGPEITWVVEDLLLRVGGDDGPAPPGTSDDKERRVYRDRWARWWQAHAAKVDLARVTQTAPLRGWTVVAQMSTSRVYEVDRDGKERWAVGNLAGPIDAHVLPGDRVLIAEHHGSKITERNFRGDVLWEKKLDDRPVSVQRLPNGNTFVTTYSALLEVTRGGKVVYNYKPEGTAGRIYGGHRMPNGRLFCVTLEGRVLELDAANGKVLRSFASGMSGCYSVQGLPGGRVLVASYNEGRVVELDASGKVVWKHSLVSAYHAERLANGHTLIASHGGMRFVEVDRKGKVVTERNTNSSNVWRVHRR